MVRWLGNFYTLILVFSSLTTFGKMCQQLFLIAGQSNAVGQGTMDESPEVMRGSGWEYNYTLDSLLNLSDPVGVVELNFEKANTGSIVPAFVRRYHQLTNREVVIISTARGGSSCHAKAELNNYGTWDSSGKLLLFDNAISKTKKALHKTNAALSGIIWLQGERDANAINADMLTKDEYREALKRLVIRFYDALGSVPFYIVQTGYYTGHPEKGFDDVRDVQKEVASRLEGVRIVYDGTGSFARKGWMKDPIHYGQPGLNDIGKTIAIRINKYENKKRNSK